MKEENRKNLSCGPQEGLLATPSDFMTMAREFFRLEAAGGIVMILAAIAALLAVNFGLSEHYSYFLNEVHFGIGFSEVAGGAFELRKSVLLWINDGLMTVFFFLVGLEIKRELLEGQLSSRDRLVLPVVGALGGMAVPALIFWGFNAQHPQNLSGWAIPSATDIAFALGILTLAGSRVPISLKILLTAIAIIDDLGAICIIALFYTGSLHTGFLIFAALLIGGLAALNRAGVKKVAPYTLLAAALWVALLKSGVHPTLAGVIGALSIPLQGKNEHSPSPLKNLEHGLHPWVVFCILPVFAFANAGVPLTDLGWEALAEPVALGILAGLFFGKQLGVFACVWGAVRLGFSPKPEGANWGQIYGVALLCGVGFTMSFFIGGLAYDGPEFQASVRLGVLGGSVLSAVTGYGVLRLSARFDKARS